MTMRIVVDLNRCQGYGQCVFLAPGVFELHGEEALMYDPGPDDEQLIPVVRAAAACPVRAIRVERPGEQASARRMARSARMGMPSSSGRRWPGCGPRRRYAKGAFGVG
jgi:ferredoxin